MESAAVSKVLRREAGRGPIEGVRVVTIGPRAVGLNELPPASCYVLAGVGGGLSAGLEVGACVLDGVPEGYVLPAGVTAGRIACSDHIVSTPAEKLRLSRETGALAVDMESAPLARRLPRGVPLYHLRAILDPANQSLPTWTLDLTDSKGNSKPLTAALSLLAHPGRLPTLLYLGKISAQATNALSQATIHLLRHLSNHND